MEFNLKNGYVSKIQSLIHETNTTGLNLDKLISDTSNVEKVNYIYRTLSSMPGIDVQDVVNCAMNNAILVRSNDMDTLNNIVKWIPIIDKSFVNTGRMTINNTIAGVGRGFKPNRIELLRTEMSNKRLDETTMIATYNRIFGKSYKTIKAIAKHDSDFFKNIAIDISDDGSERTYRLISA